MTATVGVDALDAQRAAFAERGYVRRRLDIGGPDAIAALCGELVGSAGRAVHVGDHADAWMEHYIPRSGRIAALIASDAAHSWAEAVSGERLAKHPAIWGNVYRRDEQITWHRDRRGCVQLLLCLRPSASESGGSFEVRQAGAVTPIDLAPGDALLFRATRIEHRITRLRSTAAVPRPVRMTAVARYFAVD